MPEKKTEDKPEKNIADKKPTCGIIMPISSIDNCPSDHWKDVLEIIKDVCNTNGFMPNLVSDADDVGVIHNRIVENIYSSDIVVCDVSCKNANVMFELGMRLAFDKPTIIIKDEITGYAFDTSLIEHLEYPRDLRFTTILKFKDSLGKKITATYEKATKDSNYSTFLKNFGKYKIAHLEDREITSDTFILNAIEDLKRDMRILRNNSLREAQVSSPRIRKNMFEKEFSIEEKDIFKRRVQDYLKLNNLRRHKDIIIGLDDIIEDLEKNEELRDIAENGINFRMLVKESLGMPPD